MLQFESRPLHDQFCELRRKNYPLAALADQLADFVRARLRKSVLVSGVSRTLGEQRAVYGGGTKKIDPRAALHAADLREWTAGGDEVVEPTFTALVRRASPHLFWQAIDVAAWLYAPGELATILAFLERYDEHNQLPVIPAARSRTVWLHQAGTHRPHLHVQYAGPPVRLS
jgi:hypothetical protein